MQNTQKYLKFKEKRLLLINFDSVLTSIESECLNDLNEYGLVQDYEINLSKSDVKKLLYHHLIYAICEEIRNNKEKSFKVIVVPPEIKDTHEITKFCDIEKLNKIISLLIKKLSGYLPFVIHQTDDHIFETGLCDAELEELLLILCQKASDIDNKTFTFEKIKKFAKKFDLTFLSQEYFNCIKTRLLLR